MAGQFGAFNKHVAGSRAQLTLLEGKLKAIKTMGLIGGIAAGVGVGGLMLFKAPIEEAKAWQQEAAKFSTLGFGMKVNADAQEFARGMQTYGTSARDNLSLLGDAMSVFKNLEHAEIAAPILAKMKFGNEAIFGAGGAANERQFMDMLKVIEMRRGLSSSAEFATQADFVQKAISGSRGRVNASQWLQLLKTGGVGVSQIKNESFYLGLEPLLQEFGGQRLGTSLMSVYQNLIQARGTQTSQQELNRLGLLDHSKIEFNALGQLKKALPGAFLGSNVYEQEGPLALLEKVLIPAFNKHGITSEPQILDELGRILGNRTASNLMARAYQQRASIEMQAAANRNAMGIDALNGAAQNTPEGKMIELSKQYKNLLLELGTVALPIAIKMVTGLTSVIKGMTSFAREFPLLTHGIEIAFGALMGLVAVGGALTLATAGFKALGLALMVSKGLGLGSMLFSAASGATALAGGIATAAAGFGAASLVLLGSYEIAKGLGAGKLGDWIGSKLYELMHPGEGHPDVQGPGHLMGRYSDHRFVAPAASQSIYVTVPVHIGNKKVHQEFFRLQGKSLNAPQVGPNSFDSWLSPMPAGGAGQ